MAKTLIQDRKNSIKLYMSHPPINTKKVKKMTVKALTAHHIAKVLNTVV